jgi:WD40 repeat protein/serine/threonine protein kinase
MSEIPCPNRQFLLAYQTGELSEPTAAELTTHISQCPVCQANLGTLNDAADTLVSQLRAAAPKEPFADEPQCAAMMSRAMALPVAQQAGEPVPAAGEPAPVAAGQPLPLGELGDYQLLEKLGEGGMGAVYKARHVHLDRIVALKVLPAGRADDQRTVARFHREMKAVGRVDHPNIVRAMDARVIDGKPVLAMEYVEGLDLSEVSRRCGRLRIADACEIIRQAACGLQSAHEQGLVHRDIKPSNLMLTRDGTIKILDLGLALLQASSPSAEEMTGSGQPMGTAEYMSPEQVSDAHGVDIRADIYSLGCTLYRLLAAESPFSGPQYKTAFDKMLAHLQTPVPSVRALRPDVPAELAAVLDRMLAKDPAERFATPAEVAEAIAPFGPGCNLRQLAAGQGQAAGQSSDSRMATSPYLSSSGTGTQPVHASALTSQKGTEGGPRQVEAEAKKTAASPQTAGRGGRRAVWPRLAVASLLAAGAIFVAFVIIIHVKDKAGHQQTIEVADDSQITIERKETSAAGTGQQAAGSGKQEAGSKQREASSMRLPAQRVFPGKEQLPGLVPHPAKVAGLPGRWQIETTGPREGVQNVTWSPDDRLVACTTGNLIRVYDAATMKLVRLFFGHELVEVSDLAFSPDGRWLTSAGGWDYTLRFWDLDTGRPGPAISHKSAVWRIAWRPDGGRLACRTAADLTLWNADGTLRRRWEAPCKAAFSALCWSPDGKWLASADPGNPFVGQSGENRVRLWTAEGQPGPVLEHPGPVRSLAFTPDGRRLACAEETEGGLFALRIWDTATWKSRATGKRWKWIFSRGWAPDGRRLLIANGDQRVALWDSTNDSERVLYEHAHVASVAWNHAGTWIACGACWQKWAGILSFWDVANNRLGPSLGELQTRPGPPALGPSAKWLATRSADWSGQEIRLWSTDGRPGPLLRGHSDLITARVWNPDGQLLASASQDGTVRLWKPDGHLYAALEGHGTGVASLAWSPDGKTLVSGEWGGALRLWDPASWGLIKAIAGAQKGVIYQIAWSPDGRQLASRSPKDAEVHLWSAEGSPGPVLDCRGPVHGLQWSPDGRQLATCGEKDPVVRTWNAADGSPGPAWKTGGRGVATLLWSPDGKWLAARSIDPNSFLLQRRDSGASASLDTSRSGFGDLECWSPDSKFLVFSDTPDIHVWDVAAKRRLRVLLAHTGGFSSAGACRWAADGRTLFSACAGDRTIRCWDVPTGEVTWVGLPLSGSQAATIAADGALQTTGPQAEEQLVYVVEQPDGEQRLYTLAEFRKLARGAAGGPLNSPTSRRRPPLRGSTVLSTSIIASSCSAPARISP